MLSSARKEAAPTLVLVAVPEVRHDHLAGTDPPDEAGEPVPLPDVLARDGGHDLPVERRMQAEGALQQVLRQGDGDPTGVDGCGEQRVGGHVGLFPRHDERGRVGSLDAILPAATPGQYRLIVRADLYDEVYEAADEANNRVASGSWRA